MRKTPGQESCLTTRKGGFYQEWDRSYECQMPNPDIIFHAAEAETGTISNSPGSYHGSALAGVDSRIRLSKDGMMEVVRHTEQQLELL